LAKPGEKFEQIHRPVTKSDIQCEAEVEVSDPGIKMEGGRHENFLIRESPWCGRRPNTREIAPERGDFGVTFCGWS
jgi:hypothetical protein